jgi:hypothetical protein
MLSSDSFRSCFGVNKAGMQDLDGSGDANREPHPNGSPVHTQPCLPHLSAVSPNSHVNALRCVGNHPGPGVILNFIDTSVTTD